MTMTTMMMMMMMMIDENEKDFTLKLNKLKWKAQSILVNMI